MCSGSKGWSRVVMLGTAALIAVTLSLATGCANLAGTDARRKVLTQEDAETNVASFDVVWETLRDRHWDPTLGGIDWEAAKAEYRPRVERARTTDQARSVITEMLDLLNQSHLSIVPASAYEEVFDSDSDAPTDNAAAKEAAPAASPPKGVEPALPGGAKSKPTGGPGLDVRVVGDEVLVVRVFEESPAAQAGVRPGWTLDRIEGRKLARAVARIRDGVAGSTTVPHILREAVTDRLSGPVGEPVHVVFRDGENRRVALALDRVEPKGNRYAFGNLPEFPVWMESRTIETDGAKIGYVGFNAFLDPPNLMPQYQKAIEGFIAEGVDGAVIDVRGNPGGIAAMAMGMAGWFVEDGNHYLGTFRSREAELRFVVNPRYPRFEGKVALLVDACSASCSEIFAGGLKGLARVKVFGERTAGAALPASIIRLPNGDGFMYPIADYVSSDGARFEGVGVAPDVEASYTREALLRGEDAALDLAVAWIREPVAE